MCQLIHSDQPWATRLKGVPTIFLAGPSPRGYGEGFPSDWRDQAFIMFEKRNFMGRLFVPRPSSGNSTTYDGQIEWELHHLDLADAIMFWVPRSFPDMKGLTTNVEMGLYVKSGRIVYGRPDDAPQIRYLDHICRKYAGIEPLNTLEATVESAIALSTLKNG